MARTERDLNDMAKQGQVASAEGGSLAFWLEDHSMRSKPARKIV